MREFQGMQIAAITSGRELRSHTYEKVKKLRYVKTLQTLYNGSGTLTTCQGESPDVCSKVNVVGIDVPRLDALALSRGRGKRTPRSERIIGRGAKPDCLPVGIMRPPPQVGTGTVALRPRCERELKSWVSGRIGVSAKS